MKEKLLLNNLTKGEREKTTSRGCVEVQRREITPCLPQMRAGWGFSPRAACVAEPEQPPQGLNPLLTFPLLCCRIGRVPQLRGIGSLRAAELL